VNNKRTRVINGNLVAEPFKTSAPPKAADVAGFYGGINRIMNPPNAERVSSYTASYNDVTRTAQSAGTLHKRNVPYHPNAPRNRVYEAPKDADVRGTWRPADGVTLANKTNYPFRTSQYLAQVPITGGAMETRIGFTNPGIIADQTKRYRKPLFR